MSVPPSSGRWKAVSSLLRVRDVEQRQSEARLHLKRMEIARLREELSSLRARRTAVIQRGGSGVLKERLLLDALVQISLERTRRLEALNLQSAVLVAEYRLAKSRKDAAKSLKDRCGRARDLVISRRNEETSALLARARASRELLWKDPPAEPPLQHRRDAPGGAAASPGEEDAWDD